MRTIEIDFDIHKLIETNRTSFEETANDVLRRLLSIEFKTKSTPVPSQVLPSELKGGFQTRHGVIPAGLRLRKRLKGELHEAEVTSGGILYNGRQYESPSAAACAAANTSANGWIFWEYYDQGKQKWLSLDTFRTRR